jgi:hypothetical protein
MESEVTQPVFHYDMPCLFILVSSIIVALGDLEVTAALALGARQGLKPTVILSAQRLRYLTVIERVSLACMVSTDHRLAVTQTDLYETIYWYANRSKMLNAACIICEGLSFDNARQPIGRH